MPLTDRLPQRLARLLLGLTGYGVSISLMLRAGLGNQPWDVFHQGLAKHTGLSIGTILIITGAAGSEADNVELLARIAERAAIPVVSHGARVVNLPASHPMHFGYESGPFVGDTDLVIVIESDAPWYPNQQEPPAGCRVVHIGEDPAFTRYPMRSFRSDLSIIANAGAALATLDSALADLDDAKVEARRARLEEHNAARRAAIAVPKSEHITPQALSRAIGEVAGADAVIFNEYPLMLDHCPREKPGTFFGVSPAGGLGWGLGAALGAKLAAPDRFVVATVGDGAYVFTNPTACHWVAEAHKIPVLTIVFNNSRYGAVRRATMAMFKDGAAGKDDGRFLADLDPSPPFDEMAGAQGAHAERVEQPEDLVPALTRARAAVESGKQALLNVICPY